MNCVSGGINKYHIENEVSDKEYLTAHHFEFKMANFQNVNKQVL